MSDEIRIQSVELENYRQYYGRRKIDFSDRDDGFTVVFGKNGEGKSNLLNAISWCLYHKEPHGIKADPNRKSENESLPVTNIRFITELAEEKVGETKVRIWLRKGEDVYSISRVLSVLKHQLEFKELSGGKKSLLITKYAEDKVPSGCEIIDTKKSFGIKKKGNHEVDFHDTKNQSPPRILMDQILPAGLSKYFILDGEFLEHFWRDASTIKNGIEQISQLNLLSSLRDHADKMAIPPTSGTGNLRRLAVEIERLSWNIESKDENGNEKFSEERRWTMTEEDNDNAYYHATGNPRIKDLDEDITKMHDRMEAILESLQYTGGDLDVIKQEHDSLKQTYKKKEGEKDAARKAYRYNLVTKSPYVFLKKAIDESVSIIEKRMKRGELPVRQRRQFADDLLHRGTCICGEKLDTFDDNASKRKKQIESFKEVLSGKDDLDAAVDMKYNFRHDFIDQYQSFLNKNFNDNRIKLSGLIEECSGLDQQLQGIVAKLGDADSITNKELLEEHKELRQQIESKNKILSDIKTELRLNEKEKADKKRQWEKESKKEKKHKKSVHYVSVWDKVLKHIDQVYSELRDEIRINVQNNTWNKFQELLANPSEFKSFSIEEDYSVYLTDTHEANKIRNLSAGQSLILTLAFVTSLREPTGYKFPLLVDSPLGKIDMCNRYNIATQLAKYLPKEQLTLLVTDSEYTANINPDKDCAEIPIAPFGKLLSDTIPVKHFKIIKDKSESSKNVGNSTIVSAKLAKDESTGIWGIKEDV